MHTVPDLDDLLLLEPTATDTLPVIHYACCLDETLAICGIRSDDVTIVPPDHPGATCVDCRYESNRDRCPKNGHCPTGMEYLS